MNEDLSVYVGTNEHKDTEITHTQTQLRKLNYLPIFVSDDFISRRSHMMEEHLFSRSLPSHYLLGL